MDNLHIRIGKMYGWRVQHKAARYQLRNPAGVPVGGIYRSPLQAWAHCPRFLEDVSGLLKYARHQFGSANMEYFPEKKQYRFVIGGSVMVADEHEVSYVLSTFILGLKARQDDDKTHRRDGGDA